MQIDDIQQGHCLYGFFTHLDPGERLEDADVL